MPARSTERRVVEHAAELECLFEKTILLIVYTKREFDDVGRSSRSHMAMLLHVPKMGTPCPLFEKRGLRRTVSINADLSASTHYTQNGGTLTTSYDSLFTSSSTNAVALSSIDLAAEVPQTPQTFTESFFNEYVPGQLRAGLANSATFNAGNVVVSSGSMTSTEASDLLNAFKETLSRVI